MRLRWSAVNGENPIRQTCECMCADWLIRWSAAAPLPRSLFSSQVWSGLLRPRGNGCNSSIRRVQHNHLIDLSGLEKYLTTFSARFWCGESPLLRSMSLLHDDIRRQWPSRAIPTTIRPSRPRLLHKLVQSELSSGIIPSIKKLLYLLSFSEVAILGSCLLQQLYTEKTWDVRIDQQLVDKSGISMFPRRGRPSLSPWSFFVVILRKRRLNPLLQWLHSRPPY